MTKHAVEAHAIECRAAVDAGIDRPAWTGGSLAEASLDGADLTGADLTGARLSWADLTGADLTGANLRRASLVGASLAGANLGWASLRGARLDGANLDGARLSEGTARGCAISGRAGGYAWWAVLLESGDILLQYGCERRLLSWWRAQGPELSVHYGHPPEHWAEGPMVAIAAAEALAGVAP